MIKVCYSPIFFGLLCLPYISIIFWLVICMIICRWMCTKVKCRMVSQCLFKTFTQATYNFITKFVYVHSPCKIFIHPNAENLVLVMVYFYCPIRIWIRFRFRFRLQTKLVRPHRFKFQSKLHDMGIGIEFRIKIWIQIRQWK